MAGMVVLCAPAWAQQGPPGGRGMEQPMPQRQMPQRDGQGPNADRRGMPQQRDRLTPDERRDLRRDISKHGREIYRDDRRGGRPQR